MKNKKAGLLHHVEIYVSDLRRSAEFWGWFLTKLGYEKVAEWKSGQSWAALTLCLCRPRKNTKM